MFSVAGEPLKPGSAGVGLPLDLRQRRVGIVMDNWWQTETGGAMHWNHAAFCRAADEGGQGAARCDRGRRGFTRDQMPPNKGGLLVLKKPFPHMFRTCYGDPERYAKDWGKVPNVYTTGDVALYDEDGYFTVVGRADDVLNVAGHRIGHGGRGRRAGEPSGGGGSRSDRASRRNQGREHQGIRDAARGAHGFAGTGSKAERPRPARVGWNRGASGDCVPRKTAETRSGKIMRRLLKAQELGKDVGDISTLED